MRLLGSKIVNTKSPDIPSEGIVKGAIQITPDGDPIVLLSDHGTVGGYPKIGVVISADFETLAQMPVNAEFQFRRVDFAEADRARMFEDQRIQRLCSMENINDTSK